MNQLNYTITKNAPLTADVYRMTLTGDTSAITAAGAVHQHRAGRPVPATADLRMRLGRTTA